MKVVEAQYGGAAEAAGKSGLAGAFDSLMEVLRDAGSDWQSAGTVSGWRDAAITNGVKAFLTFGITCKRKSFQGSKEALEPIFATAKGYLQRN